MLKCGKVFLLMNVLSIVFAEWFLVPEEIKHAIIVSGSWLVHRDESLRLGKQLA